MSYTPTTWANGDVVTATKLNKIEQGIAEGGGSLVVHARWNDSEGWTELDQTLNTIVSAFVSGTPVVILGQYELSGTWTTAEAYIVRYINYIHMIDDSNYSKEISTDFGNFEAVTGSDYPHTTGMQ